MNSRQRRKKILTLVALLVALLLLAAGLWYFLTRGSAPIPEVPPDRGANPPQYLYSITGSGANALIRPVGVAVTDDNRVFVTDTTRMNVEVFTSGGRFLYSFNKAGGAKMLSPISAAVNRADGLVYIADRGLKKLWAFKLDGSYVKIVPGPPKPGRLAPANWLPVGLTFDARGNLYVGEMLVQDRVMSYTPDNKLRFTFGRHGEAPNSKDKNSYGKFWFPDSLALDNRGDIWVTDSNNRRLQVYSREGKFLKVVLTGGLPRGIKFIEHPGVGSILLVVDTFGHDVGMWDKKGNNLGYFGAKGTDLAQFQYPQSIAIGPDDKIYVTDTFNSRVQVWGFRPQVPPGVAKYLPPPWCCLLPLLLLPLLLLLRKKKYLATDDFLELVVENERLELLENKRVIVMDETYARFRHVEQEDLHMAEILETEEYDEEDAREYVDQYQVDEYQGRILSMTRRKKYLLTEDPDLRRIATALGVEVMDYEEFVVRFEEQEEEEA